MAAPEQNCAENPPPPPPSSSTVEMQQMENDEDEAVTLKTIATEMKTMEMRLKLHEDQLFARFCKQLTAMEERLSERIESELELVNSSGSILENRLDNMDHDIFKRDELKYEIGHLKSELSALKRQAQQHKESLKRFAREATIFGIDLDLKHPENLEGIFKQVCEYIDFPPPKLKEIYRSKSQSRDDDDKNQVVIAKFMTPNDRNRTVEAFAEHQKKTKVGISMRAVGFDSDSYFRIYESLTQETRKILHYAISRKRQNHVEEAFAYKGAVYVRLKKGRPAVHITSKKHLKNIITL